MRFSWLDDILSIALMVLNPLTHFDSALLLITLCNEFIAFHNLMELSTQVFLNWHMFEIECIIEDPVLDQKVVGLTLDSLDE